MLALLGLDHHIGLHFDPMYCVEELRRDRSLEKHLIRKKDLLFDIIQTEIQTFSFHTHSVCWTPEPASPYMRFKRAVDGRAKFTMQRYLNKARANKRKIVR